jgi:long-chain alkane monooxygenase
MVGSPEEVADELIDWVEATGVDGFNLAYAVTPETFADFVDLVVPELQRRGRLSRGGERSATATS